MKEDTKKSEIKYKKINVDATLSLALDAIEAGVKRFIFLSTIKVNGETNIDFFNEWIRGSIIIHS